MTALNPSPAAPPSQARSQLTPGEQDLPARGLSSAVVATGISSPGRHGNAPAGSPRQPAHPFSSSQHQPMHNLRGCRSERNKAIPVRVGDDADLRAGRAHLSRKRPVLRLFSSMVARGSSLVGHRYQPSLVISQTPVSCAQSPVLQSEIGTGDRDNASHGE